MLSRIFYAFSRRGRLPPVHIPRLSKINNPRELLNHTPLILRQIEAINAYNLDPQNNSPLGQLAKKLRVSKEHLRGLNQLKVTAYDPNGQEFLVEIGQGQPKVLGGLVGVGFGGEEFKPGKHFTFDRGIIRAMEYLIKPNELILFNLPTNFNQDELVQKLPKELNITHLNVKYCLLGLPSCCIVTTGSKQKDRHNIPSQLIIDGKTVFVRGRGNSTSLSNRKLVVKGLPKSQSPASLLAELSKYGRVLNFDMPLNIERKATKDQVKKAFKDSKSLIRIVEHKKDGSTQTEFYPRQAEPIIELNSASPHEFLKKSADRSQQLQQRFKRRLMYSQDIDCYEDTRSSPHTLQSKGYCIVIYSCMQQAQNCYFHMSQKFDVDFFDKPEFEYDAEHKKAILRFIGNRVTEAEDKKFSEEQQMYEKAASAVDYNMEQTLEDELRVKALELYELRGQAITNDILNQASQDSEYVVSLQEFLQNKKEVEREKYKQVDKNTSRSFSDHAEMKLFGKVLPPRSQKKPEVVPKTDFVFQKPLNWDEPYNILYREEVSSLKAEAEDEYLRGYSDYFHTHKLVPANQNEQVKGKGRVSSDRSKQVAETAPETEAAEVPAQEPAPPAAKPSKGKKPKKQFSTLNKFVRIHRPLTQSQKYEYLFKYNQMVSQLVSEYFGKFSKQKLSNNKKTYKFPTLNRNQLFKKDGSDFLTQQQLKKALLTHCDPKQAADQLSQYLMREEAWKCYPYGFREQMLKMIRENRSQMLQQHVDNGIVVETYELNSQEDPKDVANTINLYEAKHGDHYEGLIKDNKKYIVRTRRIEPALSIDMSQKFIKYAQKFQPNTDKIPEEKQIEMLKKIMKTKQLPAELMKIKQGQKVTQQQVKQQKQQLQKNIDQIIDEIVAESGVPKKFIHQALRLSEKEGIPTHLVNDFRQQLEIEKARLNSKEIKKDDLIKDSSRGGAVLGGKYVVSKFRQQ